MDDPCVAARPDSPCIRSSIWPGLAVALLAAAVAVGVQQGLPALSPLLVAIVLGVVAANAIRLPASLQPGLRVAAKRLLRIGIVLLGLQVSLTDIAGLGWGVVATVVVIVAGGILATLGLGRLLGVSPMQRLLIACGFSICGAAAIAGVEGVVEAEDDDVASAIGLVVLYGTAMIALVPPLMDALPLSVHQQGLVTGGSIHEVAQVVAAGGLIGSGTLAAAVVVKLARVLMLAPVIVILGLQRRRAGAGTGDTARPPIMPLFVAGFLAACLLHSVIRLPAPALDVAKIAETAALAAAMFALGTGVHRDLLKRVGGRPVLLGALSTTVVFLLALGGALLSGR